MKTKTNDHINDLIEADKFVQNMISRKDGGMDYPYWHGWALREAYVAGLNSARIKCEETIKKINN